MNESTKFGQHSVKVFDSNIYWFWASFSREIGTASSFATLEMKTKQNPKGQRLGKQNWLLVRLFKFLVSKTVWFSTWHYLNYDEQMLSLPLITVYIFLFTNIFAVTVTFPFIKFGKHQPGTWINFRFLSKRSINDSYKSSRF